MANVNPFLRVFRRSAALGRVPIGGAYGRSSMYVEEVESRILHSADLAALALSSAALGEVEMRIVDPAPPPQVSALGAEHNTKHEVVFVDVATPHYQQLIDDIVERAGSGREVKVVIIEGGSDGIQKITDVLSGLDNIDAIHIISHGSEGSVQLGSNVLDLATLQQHAAQIHGWSSALTENADLLIYGCDVAQSTDGSLFVKTLANLTGADVAASDDVTGNVTRGGNWILEYHTGAIEAASVISAATQQSWQGTLANSAPVLAGATNLASISEDAAANAGASVSALIAGHITDVDGGALGGIAITAVDDSNGVWQYSLDSGGTWTGFGTPSPASARLLAADVTTYVRFVPNANWNGTVTNGLTFRAWDQTSGVAGGTADTTTATLTVQDNFGAASYTNNDGTASWSAGWIDTDGNPSAGTIQITGGELVLSTFLGSDSIYREANLSGATSAVLSFNYNNQLGLLGLLGSVSLEASNNGGASYTSVGTFSSGANTGSGAFSVDISSYIAANTRIKFLMTGLSLGGSLNVDNLQISYVTPLNGGATAFSTATASSSITVVSVNDSPAGTNNTITTLEDTDYTFVGADFGFTDPSDTPANNLLAVSITTLPTAGALTLSGVAVTAGQTVSVIDINAGNLKFSPLANANGAAYASFTFQVQDDGGTANGGVDLDASPNTMTVNVTSVNDAPAGTSTTVTTLEDTDYIFAAADFGFTDPIDSPANALSAIKTTTLPTAGGLKLSGVAVTAGQTVSVTDINAGNLKFSPLANANGAGYASFTFQVQDDGGTANGGVDLDASSNTITVNVTSVNDAPSGTSTTVTTLEDTDYTFAAADFGFTDPIDSPTNAVSALKITTLPTAGALTLSGVAVSAGQLISVANINAGNLKFSPAANVNGAGYASFTFQVQDDGGTANSGVDLDASPNTITVNVSSVNDMPAGTNNIVTTLEDTDYTFMTADFGFTDPSDAPANSLLAVRIASLPVAGSLTLSGVAVSAGQSISVANINAGNLKFSSAANASGAGYASFTFEVQDDGGTANSGVDLDASPNTITVNVTAVNDAPAGTSTAVTTREDTDYIFAAADFGFTDPNDVPANSLLAVNIASLPVAGSLMLGGVFVTAGQSISVANINAGNLKFSPAANASGAGYASFTFQVQDDGGTANGGVDIDASANTMTVNVTAVNDAPVGANKTITTLEDTDYTFVGADFGFTDPTDTPANNLLAVKIATLPTAGALTVSGVAVSVGQSISAANINAGNLKFSPAANGNSAGYASFTFQVQDDGGTANGGVDLAVSPNTMTVNVTSVNDAPAGASTTVTTLEDTDYIFAAADFGFTDPNDTPANALSAVKITTLPAAGGLQLSGVAVTAGQMVSVTDITAGNLKFSPLANTNGAAYASFSFQVQDDGGGADLDAVARTMTIDVSPVNDAPVLPTNNALALNQGSAAAITNTMLQATDIDNSAAQLVFTLSSAPVRGRLELTTAPGAALTRFTQSDIDANRLVYIHDDSFTTSDAFTFTVNDGAGGAIGTATFSININPVNHAPHNGVPGPQMMAQGTSIVFSSANGNAISVADPDAAVNPLQVTLTARDGWITLANTIGLSFSAGTGVHDTAVTFVGTLANINAALDGLVFTPVLDYNGDTVIAISTDDLGSTGLGGRQTTPNTVSINVAATAATSIMADMSGGGLGAGVAVAAPITVSKIDTGGSTAMARPSLATQASAVSPAEPTQSTPGTLLDAESIGSTRGSSPAALSQIALLSADGQQSSREYRYLLTAFVPGVSPLVFGVDGPTEDMLVFASAEGSVLVPARVQSVHDPAMLDALNEMRQSLSEEGRFAANTLAVAAAAALGLSVGYVIWLLRGGILVSSLLSSLPAWRLVDPLPILGRLDDDEDDDEAADDTLESLVARTNFVASAHAADPGQAKSLSITPI
jgi:uncharacterized protein DUF4347/cadherin-like protein/Big-like domain-containing protein